VSVYVGGNGERESVENVFFFFLLPPSIFFFKERLKRCVYVGVVMGKN